MDDAAFDSILDLENDFFTEGYRAGVADGKQVGLIEGKLFGIEKGYEKALAMGRLHGRALVWSARISRADHDTPGATSGNSPSLPKESPSTENLSLVDIFEKLDGLQSNARLQKHIDALLNYTDGTGMSAANSDEAVAAFEEQLAKASAKAKIVATIAGEPINPAHSEKRGIEDANGLTARR